jgi:hypothetical protein
MHPYTLHMCTTFSTNVFGLVSLIHTSMLRGQHQVYQIHVESSSMTPHPSHCNDLQSKNYTQLPSLLKHSSWHPVAQYVEVIGSQPLLSYMDYTTRLSIWLHVLLILYAFYRYNGTSTTSFPICISTIFPLAITSLQFIHKTIICFWMQVII